MQQLIYIGLAGALGTMCRYGITLLGSYGVCSVNLIGCFLIGFFDMAFSVLWKDYASFRPIIITGLLGGLTTFSSFILEIIILFERQQFYSLCYYILISILGGIGLFLLGRMCVKVFI